LAIVLGVEKAMVSGLVEGIACNRLSHSLGRVPVDVVDTGPAGGFIVLAAKR